MIELLRLTLHIIASLFKPRTKLVAEILVLRQQLNVLRRQVSKRPQLSNTDRFLFVWLYRWFVAKALTRAGRPVHFTTVARWKKRAWQVEGRLAHSLASAMRMVDLAVPLLTRDPTTKAVDIVGAVAAHRQSMPEDQGLNPV